MGSGPSAPGTSRYTSWRINGCVEKAKKVSRLEATKLSKDAYFTPQRGCPSEAKLQRLDTERFSHKQALVQRRLLCLVSLLLHDVVPEASFSTFRRGPTSYQRTGCPECGYPANLKATAAQISAYSQIPNL